MRRTPSLVAAALLCFAASDASAQNATTRVTVTDTLIGEYHVDNRNGNDTDDDYGLALTRLNLTANAGDLSTSVRVDGFYYYDPPTDAYVNQAHLERISIGYRLGDFRIEAGDFYQQLGRGIVLSIRKVDEAGLDVAIRGGTVEYRGRDHRAMVFAGLTNPANIDVVTQRRVRNVDDVVVGFDYNLRAIDPIDVHVYGAYIEPSVSQWDEFSEVAQGLFDEDARVDRTLSAGVSIEAPSVTDWLSLYAEGDVQQREALDEEPTGSAVYGTADLAFGDTSILLEGLRLDTWAQPGSPNTALGDRFVYNQPPTLERIDQEVANNEHARGGRVRVEHYFFDLDLRLFASGLYKQTAPEEPSEVTVLHTYGGFEQYYQDGRSRVKLSGGWREENSTNGDRNDPVKDMWHIEADLVQSFGVGYSLHLLSTNEFRRLAEDADTLDPYQRGSTLLGIERTGLGALTFEFGYDTQDEQDGIANFFYAGIAEWEISDHFTLTAIGGTQRGGLKCINGICREYPGFAGGRFELVTRF